MVDIVVVVEKSFVKGGEEVFAKNVKEVVRVKKARKRAMTVSNGFNDRNGFGACRKELEVRVEVVRGIQRRRAK